MIRNRYLLAADLPLVLISAAGAFAIRFDLRFFDHRPEFLPFAALALVTKPVVYYLYGLYARVWRYAGVHELLTITFAATTASLVMAVAVTAAHLADAEFGFSRSVVVVDWLLSVALVGGSRMSVRLLAERPALPLIDRRQGERGLKRLLILGAGDAGAMVARELERKAGPDLVVVGFLDDDVAKRGKWIHGLRVLGALSTLEQVVTSCRIDEVLIAMPSAAGSVLRDVAETCRRCGVLSRTMPGVLELVDGQVSVSRLRQIEITDLLRREPVHGEVDCSIYLAARSVLVTGAGGSIGQELCRQVAMARPASLTLLGHGENSLFEARRRLAELFPDLDVDVMVADVRDRSRIASAFRLHRPDVVLHAAAHKHVPLMQENPEEAVTNNVLGTRNVLEQALDHGVGRMVLISTDKAVAPCSIMGASKRVSEMLVRDAALRHRVPYAVVRFGNVLGSRGSVVPLFQRQIERGGPITITHPDVRRYFMTIPEAVHLVLQAGALATGGELFVLEMGEPVRVVDLARDMIKLSTGNGESVSIVFTGLRPGEKLEEILWEPGARIERTAHPSVLRVSEVYAYAGAALAQAVDRLAAAAERGDRLAIEHAFIEMIPGYSPAATAIAAT